MKFARRPWVALGVLLLAFTISCRRAPEARNVLIISVDTLRADFLGCGGDPRGTSPHLDRLARRGLFSVRGLSTTTWTLPSHMSLLTGQYPTSHGVIGDGRGLVPEKVTLAEVLQAEGYRTGGFVTGPYLHRAYGFDQGFEVYRHCAGWGEQLNDDGQIANVIGVNLKSHSGVTNPDLYAYIDAWFSSFRRDPWFLFAHFWDVHYDFEPPGVFETWADPDYTGRIDGRGFIPNGRIAVGMPERDLAHLLNLYRAEVRWTDRWIGKLLRRIEERGDLDRTLVAVVSDHGEEFFEHGNKGHRINLYDETLRVPIILWGPAADWPAGALREEPASLVDIWPTVAAALGHEPRETLQGVDLTGEARAGGELVVAELHRELDAAISAEWKLVRHRATGRPELYDLRADPGETRNVAAEHADIVGPLLRRLGSGDHARFSPNRTVEPQLDERTEAELRALGYTE